MLKNSMAAGFEGRISDNVFCEHETGLQLLQHFLVFQLFVPAGQHLSLELRQSFLLFGAKVFEGGTDLFAQDSV